MKNLKLAALLMTAGLFITLGNQANAAGVGYIDYQKVQDSFPFAQQAVKEIDAKEKNEFLNKYHIQGSDQAKVKLGLFHENELVAVMTFGNPRFNKNYDWELIRYATKFEYQVLGGAGKLLSYFRKHYKGSIITYADRRFSQGDLYNKLGFKFLRYSSPNYVWLKDNMILKRYQTMKLTLENIIGEENIDYTKSETENMINNGYYQIFDCGNIVYEII